MKRTLIQFDEETYDKLRRRAFDEGKSIAAMTRELVAKGLQLKNKKRVTRVQQFSFVGAGRSNQGAIAPVSERHDEALARASRK